MQCVHSSSPSVASINRLRPVHLKGILRDCGRPKTARCRVQGQARSAGCPRDGKFYSKEVTLSAMGPFAEDIKLPEGHLARYYSRILSLRRRRRPGSPGLDARVSGRGV
jgi:hypothetical protein